MKCSEHYLPYFSLQINQPGTFYIKELSALTNWPQHVFQITNTNSNKVPSDIFRSNPGDVEEGAAVEPQAERDRDLGGPAARHRLSGVGRVPPQVGRRARAPFADSAETLIFFIQKRGERSKKHAHTLYPAGALE